MFFIAALPRSRTAWISELFTYGDTYCFHELSDEVKGPDLGEAMNLEYKNVGNSDSGLLRFDFQKMYPEAKTVIIHRSMDEVAASLHKAGLIVNLEGIEECVNKLCSLDGLHVHFNKLDERISDIYTYCTDEQLDMDRAKRFKSLNIQTHPIKHTSAWFRQNDQLGK